MLKFTNNNYGVMGLTLSQIGLFLATGILLTAVFTVVFFNNGEKINELHTITSGFSSLVQDMDARFFENITLYQFPEKGYSYKIQLSTEYIVVSAVGTWNDDLSVKERFVIRPWPCSPDQNWTTGGELRTYLNRTYGHSGTADDPITPAILLDFLEEYNTTASLLVLHPVEIYQSNPVYVEKVFVFYDPETKYDVLLVYQSIE
jgi:hypothetical protein